MQTLPFKLKKLKGAVFCLKMVYCPGNRFCNSTRIYKEYCEKYVQCPSFPCNVTNCQTVIEEMVECEVITYYHVNPKPVDPDNDDTMKIIAGIVGGVFIILVFGLLLYYKIKSCRASQNELFDQPPQPSYLEEEDQDKPSLIHRIYLWFADNTVCYYAKSGCLIFIWLIGIIWMYKMIRKRWRKFKGYE